MNFCGGVMFHHFHNMRERERENVNRSHIISQGSIDSDMLYQMLCFIRENGYVMLNPEEFIHKVQRNTLQNNETCITFDDGLKCQIDIALPILNRAGIKAFWFVYTSPIQGELEKLEVYRHFRFSRFDDVEDFYDLFFEIVREKQKELGVNYRTSMDDFIRSNYAGEFAFYSESDRKYRYFRDVILGRKKYFNIVDRMMDDSGYDPKLYADMLWLNDEDIKRLHCEGHYIGLHSHTHPTNMEELSFESQMKEYRENMEIIQSLTGSEPRVVSYPCGSYNKDTEIIMKELGVILGFDPKTKTSWNDKMHIPREDHANIIREMHSLGVL
ncbi:MAG: polysaccharide deacetylase family protein [Synergistaceae bacterium]|jgi:peptidoglycan/xylan/chitin deacetylase (PgdA/CDA1 family)|nr:polysaccharide deacetylase family protein [Synergistaceae bacterium]